MDTVPAGVILSSCTAGKVKDLDSGEYLAYFTATAAGSYAVSVTLGGQNIAGSPFPATVTPVEVDAGCSCAGGDGILGARSGHLVRTTALPLHHALLKSHASIMAASKWCLHRKSAASHHM